MSEHKYIFHYILAIILAGIASEFVLFYADYNEQVEYEADNPRLPIQNISDANNSIVFNADALQSIKYPQSIYIFTTYHEQPMFKVTSQNYTDWSNSTIEINMSYIKQVRHENNTMIISIRND